jgi:hypothetical protein
VRPSRTWRLRVRSSTSWTCGTGRNASPPTACSRSPATARSPDPQRLLASIAAGCEWLQQHSADLLPDSLVFARIGLQAAGLPFPRTLHRRHAGRTSEALIPLSPAFEAVAANAARAYLAYRGKPPFADESSSLSHRDFARPPRRRRAAPIDRVTINAALADAVRGRPSARSLRWMRQRGNTGFVLTHQLLAWLFCVWNGRVHDAPEGARRVARRVWGDATRARGYGDLLAQQAAFLALGGWPLVGLQPLVHRLLRNQDRGDGGWHYFERRLSGASETLSRVCDGRSPMLGWPIACAEGEFGALVTAVDRAHRGHTTALSICALGVFRARTTRGSIP